VRATGRRNASCRFKTFPNVAVTVDLLSTGVDVPAIGNIVFLRRMNSRILYDQTTTQLSPLLGN
jgi:type I restriction enzyme R subunit